MLRLSLACWDYDRTRALADGRVQPDGIDLVYLNQPVEETFFRMMKFREFDASEMSLSSYVASLGRSEPPFIAIPAFPSRYFRHSCIFVSAKSGVRKPEDLKGKRIGYSSYGALSHYSAVNFARRMGWDPDRDISLISNGMSIDVLKSGRVDALVGDETAWTMGIKAGFRDLVDLNQYQFPMAGSGVNAAKSWLANNREAARRFVKATVESIALIKTDKQVAFAAMAKWYGISDPAHQQSIYAEAAKLASKPYPHVDGIKGVMATYTYHEMARHKPEDFYDASFISELDKSGYIDGLYK
jgi:NitT/TauT family transport system substrate-binding protein